jgi:hypothetical protein
MERDVAWSSVVRANDLLILVRDARLADGVYGRGCRKFNLTASAVFTAWQAGWYRPLAASD